MTDYEKAVIAAALSFGVGIASGVLLEKWRERRALRKGVLERYIAAVTAPEIDQDSYRRFAALQRSGAWRLSQQELKHFADDVCGRGFRHPFEAWRQCFPKMRAFPSEFLIWAKNKEVDLSEPESAIRKMAEELDAKNIPECPGPGIFIL
jgi:hypothetical protein